MEDWIKRRRDEAQGHSTRRVLLALLAAREQSARELRSQLPEEPSLSALVYHLAILQDADLVAATSDGRYGLA